MACPRSNRWSTGRLFFGLVLAFFMVLPAIAAAPAVAQEGTPEATTRTGPRFVIRPVDGRDGEFFTLEGEAGTVNELKVVLGNVDEEELTLRTFASDAVPMTNGGFTIADEEAPRTGVATWIEYPAETFTFQPGEGVERTFTVTIPEDARPGQHIAGLALQTAEPLEVEGTTMFRQIIRKSIAVFIIVPGPVEPAFSLGEPALVPGGSIPRIEIPVINSGNVLVRPKGELTLTNEAGEVVVTAPIEMGSVYADFTVPLAIGLPTPPPDGDYTLNVNLTDERSGVSALIENSVFTISAATLAPPQYTLASEVTLAPNVEDPAFADVRLTITNDGDPAPNAEVLLDVTLNGEIVETFTLAASLALPRGSTEVNQRYIPPTGWEAGEWGFTFRLNVIDESTGVSTTVATDDSLPLIEVGE